MTNREKYGEEIKNHKGNTDFCNDFIVPHVFGTKSCEGIACAYCATRVALWLDDEYVEEPKPEVDWSKVEVDTPILVSDDPKKTWRKRYFAKYENGIVYAFEGGTTSWSCDEQMLNWSYAKLAENES